MWEKGSDGGWKSSYVTSSGGQSVYIKRTGLNSSTITHAAFDVEWSTTSGSNCYAALNSTAIVFIRGVPEISRTFEWSGAVNNVTSITLNPSGGRGNTIKLTRLLVRGTGVDPFCSACVEEAEYQHNLDTAFADLKTALQNNPTAAEADPVIATPLNNYKTAIQTAFGVTFSTESGASDWGVISLHFAHLGLQATAEAFERWVENYIELNNLCGSVGRFDLFRRVMGQMTLMNAAEEQDNVALTTGATIRVYRKPGANRQWVMTPNNLIHELGHSFTRATGYDTVLIGSIEQALQNTSLVTDYTRDGLGPEYLRPPQGIYDQLYFEHAVISNDNGVAIFTKLNPTYPDLTPDNYLLFDLFGTNFALWNSSYNMYGLRARVDIFVQNWPPSSDSDDVKIRELVADSFMNWVRNSFTGTKGADWQNFFEVTIGKFMRNATVYRNGMSTHYIQNGVIRATQTEIRNFIGDPEWPNLRLIPDPTVSDALIGSAPISGRDPLQSKIYGWWEGGTPMTKWLLVDSISSDGKRLAWVVSSGMDVNEANDLIDNPPPLGNRILDVNPLDPGREFSPADLCTILGLLVANFTGS